MVLSKWQGEKEAGLAVSSEISFSSKECEDNVVWQ
jgi:hypothetical protein